MNNEQIPRDYRQAIPNAELTHAQIDAFHEAVHQASLLNLHGNYQEAIDKAQEILAQLVGDSTGKNLAAASERLTHCSNTIAFALHVLGTSERFRSNYPIAGELYEQSYDICRGTKNISGQARALGNLAIIKGVLNNVEEETKLTLQALQLDSDAGNKRGVAMWQANLGTIYGKSGDYAQAMEHLAAALKLDEELGNELGLASRHGNIGTVHQHLGHDNLALWHLRKALAIDEKLGDKKRIATTLNNIGMVLSDQGDCHAAIEYFSQALAIDEVLGNPKGIAIRLSNLGNMYLALEDYSLALEYQRKALAIDIELKNRRGEAIRTSSIGEVYLRQHTSEDDLVQAELYLLEGLNISVETGNKYHAVGCHAELATLYEMLHQNEKVIYHLKKCRALENELHGEDSRKRILAAEQQQNIRRQELEFQLARTAAVTELEVTNKLLHRVLPGTIANRIIHGEEEIADYFPSVSILFADIKGFTPLTSDLPAHAVLRILKFVFHHFDAIIRKHGCEKIKTIGDGYLAVAGAPVPCVNHAERLAAAALEMIQPLAFPPEMSEFFPNNYRMEIRIGLHSGSVIAGVVGEDRFVYDIYSDSVNTASRMESHGEAGKVHVSEEFMRAFAGTEHDPSTFDGDDTSIRFLPRGEMDIKGKGKLKTYFMEHP